MSVILFVTAAAHLFYTPFTKVEESFNLQAMHDILYLRHNFSQYDHHEFPGVVPRTFIGPLFVSIISSPFVLLFEAIEIHKFWAQYVVRLVLTGTVAVTWNNLRKVITKQYGLMVSFWFTLITISQFHFMFYMSRPLPNTMALPLVLSAVTAWMKGHDKNFIIYSGIAVVIFRSELALLLGPLLAFNLFRRKTSIKDLFSVGVPAGIIILSATVIVDSFFWQRPLWPEGQVLWYNTILNKSANWGTSPFLWYFYSAIPRAMGFSLLFVPIGLYLEPRIRPLVLTVIAFVFIYSFLPHKELRFIIYIFPVLNIAVACACNRLWVNAGKSLWNGLLAVIAGGHIAGNVLLTLFLLVVSSTNYPGGVALSRLHRIETGSSNVSIHISNLAAQSGVSRFMEIRPDWTYDKTENLKLNEDSLQKYTHLLVEAKVKLNEDWHVVQENFETVEFVDCFNSIGIQYNSFLPVRIKTKPCIGIMKRRPGKARKQKQPEIIKEKIAVKEELYDEGEGLHDVKKELHDVKEELHDVKEELHDVKEELHDIKEPPESPAVQKKNTTIEIENESVEDADVSPNETTKSPPGETMDDYDDGVVISNDESHEEGHSTQTKEINFTELRNIALGQITKSTRAKLREIIEQHYRSKGSTIENDSIELRNESSTQKNASGEKRSARKTVKSIIRQEKIKEMIEKISNMDLTKYCDLNKVSTKDCLKRVIDDIDESNK